MQQENKRFKGGAGYATNSESKNQLTKLGAAGSKIAREEDMGLLAANVKDKVFNLANGQEVKSQEVEMETS